MNKRITRELRNRLAPLSAVAVTFATITVVPAATTMVATAGGTAGHQTKVAWMDRTASVGRDQRAAIGSSDDGRYLATGYRVNTLRLAARALGSEIR